MKMKKRSQRFALEALEPRVPLAGDISVSTTNGNLQIIGDAGDNNISIQQVATGQFRISGNNGERFQFNGRFSAGPVDVRMVTGGIMVSTGAGADTVSVAGLPGNAPFGNFLTIVTGAGADRVFVSDMRIGGAEFPSRIAVPSELNRVSGQIGREATLNAKSAGSLTIDTAFGDSLSDGDQVTIDKITVNGPTWIQTGLGNDSIWLDGMTAMQTVINTDRGADRVEIAVSGPVRLASLNMALGTDNDDVMIGSNTLQFTAAGTSVIDGGPGANTFAYLSNISRQSVGSLKNPSLTGFQKVWANPSDRLPVSSSTTAIVPVTSPSNWRRPVTRQRVLTPPVRVRLRSLGTHR